MTATIDLMNNPPDAAALAARLNQELPTLASQLSMRDAGILLSTGGQLVKILEALAPSKRKRRSS